jgi:hypothetical protein
MCWKGIHRQNKIYRPVVAAESLSGNKSRSHATFLRAPQAPIASPCLSTSRPASTAKAISVFAMLLSSSRLTRIIRHRWPSPTCRFPLREILVPLDRKPNNWQSMIPYGYMYLDLNQHHTSLPVRWCGWIWEERQRRVFIATIARI